MKKYAFKLYVNGTTLYSQNAITNLARLCREVFQSDCEVIIVDVLKDPEQAEIDKILATPTLIRMRPKPVRRVIGDLSNISLVMAALALQKQPLSDDNAQEGEIP